MINLNKKTIVVSTASLLIIGGSAFALIVTTAGGTITGQASTTPRTVTIAASSQSGDIRDDAGQTFGVEAQNPSGATLQFTIPTPTLSFDLSNAVVVDTNQPTCTPSMFTGAWVGTPPTGTTTVPPGNGVGDPGKRAIGTYVVKPGTNANVTNCGGAKAVVSFG
jgi:hypothetical protein